ncbi:VID27-domain-containing protein [Nadsonia fulvescens var. elongata DSM 6958]|uniref:VID27-domain-containing protein n=1 Tax=Nadsonia fulvescens var. elongata DSM 6958 TaxID=857566 RepID=A0A1E3PSZ4_9ASCO|nr:VID27-domain-containing protein [Nadsonia fulvescens var. elongata DSM 6958]
MNFLRKFLSSSSKQELVVIPSGQLFLTRSPNSPKGDSECIYKDAIATIRRTSTNFHHQLVIQRVYEEGEEQLYDEEEEGSDTDSSDDEWTFLIDEALHICYFERNGHIIISWRDLSGEPGDLFEFVCDEATKPSLLDDFDLTARKCQFERKFQQAYTDDYESDLELFNFELDELSNFVAKNSAPPSPKTRLSIRGRSPSNTHYQSNINEEDKKSSSASSTEVSLSVSDETPLKPPFEEIANATEIKHRTNAKATELAQEVKGDILAREIASLHLFDASMGVFVLQEASVVANVVDAGKWEYWLNASSSDKNYISMLITSDINPVFSFEHLSFIFNFCSIDGGLFSWLLKFKDFDTLSRFQEGVMRALWEQTSHQKWLKSRDDEREYVLESFLNLSIGDKDGEKSDEDENNSDDDQYYEKPQATVSTKKAAVVVDDEENYDDENVTLSGTGKNSQLSVGYNTDRAFVVRGSKIGVFKQTEDNNLEFSATIEDVSTPKGRKFSPDKIMLHTEDRSLVMQDPNNMHYLYRMDLEYGKIVDEWKVSEDVKVRQINPADKFAQMTGEQTFLGISSNGLFRIDPRLSGDKIVTSEMKTYAINNDFSALATTESGHIALASNKGDIRLYDRLGINAKTNIPALGDPIIGLEVSSGGEWVLATCKTYILLIDATIKQGKNAGSIGFLRSFDKDSKPRPKRLQISPEHVAFMQNETGKPLSFTKAYFNTGISAKEGTIITSSGPYVITWNMKKVLRNEKDGAYLIKRYSDNVTADNFKFGSDKNVILAFENDVAMVNRRSFRKPTKETLTGTKIARS